MTLHLYVVAIQLNRQMPPRVSKLAGPLEDETIPTTVLPIDGEAIVIHIWWPGGLPTAKATKEAHLGVLHYVHDLMLEKSVEDASAKSLAAALAATILALAGASDEDGS